MFKKLSKDTPLKLTPCKSSVQRSLTKQVAEQFSELLSKEELATIIDKDAPMFLARVPDTYFQLMIQNKRVIFFQESGGQGAGPWIPHLHILHMYPFLLPRLQVDIGGAKFVLGGANVMCPGLTSPGGRLPDVNLPEDTPVAVYLEGKEHAAAIGVLAISIDEIRVAKGGMGVTSYHHVGDGLWALATL